MAATLRELSAAGTGFAVSAVAGFGGGADGFSFVLAVAFGASGADPFTDAFGSA
jgi:hypothetical protein